MVTAIIVAAGRGTRMGQNVDKLFLPVAGRPLVAHTWARYDASPAVDRLVLVVRPGMERAFSEMAERYGFAKPHRFAEGGPERQDSVWNGLQAIVDATDLVAIHDAARPCVAEEIIEQTLRSARDFGAAVAAQRVVDTIKTSTDGVAISGTVDRSTLWSVQTPQAFRLPIIRQAITEAYRRNLKLTDDTAACELIGQRVMLVENRFPNPKITTPADVALLEVLLTPGRESGFD